MATRTRRGVGTWVSGGAVNASPATEPVVDKLESMDEEESSESPKKKTPPHWVKLGPDGKAIKRKPNPAKRNAMFRKHLQPKTAVMCLNELVTGLKYETEAMAPIGNYSASVEVEGVTYRGYGSSKALAKQAAAEAALVSFVKPPPPKPAAGEPEVSMEDETPWKTIASFAMYKLFAEWSEGSGSRQGGSMHPMDGSFDNSNAVPDLRNYLTNIQHTQMEETAAPPMQRFPGMPAPASRKRPAANQATGPKPAQQMKPAKNLSEEIKTGNHPVMVLHQLYPAIHYETQEDVDSVSKVKSFTMTADVEGTTYAGHGNNTKKAKFELAKTVLREAFAVENVYEGN